MKKKLEGEMTNEHQRKLEENREDDKSQIRTKGGSLREMIKSPFFSSMAKRTEGCQKFQLSQILSDATLVEIFKRTVSLSSEIHG